MATQFHLDQARGVKDAPDIEMPPLPLEAPEVSEPIEQEKVDEAPVVEVQQNESDQVSDKEKNFRTLRAERDHAQRERDDMLRRLQDYEAKVNPQQTIIPEDDEIRLAPDDLAEGKHLSKMARKMQKLEEQLKTYQQQSSLSATEMRLKHEYPDFDKIVSKENIEALRNAYPELADTLNANPNIYNKAVSAYTLIKKLGIHPDDTYQADKEKAQKNAAKPRPMTSVAPTHGTSPLSQANAFANGLTDDLRTQLHKEMLEARKGY